jgi:hypothetical protein
MFARLRHCVSGDCCVRDLAALSLSGTLHLSFDDQEAV